MKIYTVPSHLAPKDLLLLSDPSEARLGQYLPEGVCYVVEDGGDILASCLVSRETPEVFEVRNIAVEPDKQAEGIGTQLLRYVIEDVRHKGAKRLEVGTGTFGYPLIFYQRAGFRVYAVERGYYLINYEEPL